LTIVLLADASKEFGGRTWDGAEPIRAKAIDRILAGEFFARG